MLFYVYECKHKNQIGYEVRHIPTESSCWLGTGVNTVFCFKTQIEYCGKMLNVVQIGDEVAIDPWKESICGDLGLSPNKRKLPKTKIAEGDFMAPNGPVSNFN